MPKFTVRRLRPTLPLCGAVLVALSLASAVDAQGQTPPLITDRPDFTESPFTVPLGSFQLEAGLTFESDNGFESLSGPEALLRWSPLLGFEVRFEAPGYVDTDTSSGATDIAIGAKLELGAVSAWDFGVIALLGLPTGDDEVSAGGVEPQLIVTAGRDVGEGWSLGVQGSIMRPGKGGGVNLMSTVVAGRGLSQRVGAFLEVATERVSGGSVASLLHGGLTFSLIPTLQLDVHAALGVTDNAPDGTIGWGLSTRFD